MAEGGASLWTPANVVTVARVALVPVWLVLAEAARSSGDAVLAMGTLALYVLIALTDKLDGWLARSRREVTTFGKFLDPIADKLAVIVALLYLLERGDVASWVVLVVIARELLVDGMRMVVASQGTVVAASSLGKWKTATTMVAISLMLLAVVVDAGVVPASEASFVATVSHAGLACMYVACALTVWSGVDYFVKCWPLMRGGE